MGGHHRCCVDGCDRNDKRYPTKLCKRSHVKDFPEDERNQHLIWQVSKGLASFKCGKQMRICSNHFLEGKPTTENSFPTLFLNVSEILMILRRKERGNQ